MKNHNPFNRFPGEREYYSDVKVNGAVAERSDPHRFVGKIKEAAREQSLKLNGRGIVVIHSCRFGFNDILGFYIDGAYIVNRDFSRVRREYREHHEKNRIVDFELFDAIQQHLHGKGL